jgi:SAM-dependent methyltransferase
MLKRIRSFLGMSPREMAYAIAWKLGMRRPPSPDTHRAIFTRIYAANEWGDPESRSGPGSTERRAAGVRPALLDLLERYSVSTVVDAPCGDFNFFRGAAADLLEAYVGVDVVEELVVANQAAYGDARHRFLRMDLTCDALPKADLILCRDAFIHFSFADVLRAVANFRKSGSTFLLTTSFIDHPRNEDARTGGWRPLNLQAAPFHFPEPLERIHDTPLDGSHAGKRLCLWRLDSLGR